MTENQGKDWILATVRQPFNKVLRPSMSIADLPDCGDAVKLLTPGEAVENILFLLDSGA